MLGDGCARRFARGRVRRAGRALEFAGPRTVSSSHADRLRLEQALGNLVDNALRHGEGVVRVSAERDGEGASWFRGRADEGAGPACRASPHAFERFSRADDARTGDGAGLGLALVDAVARAHGGTASVEGAYSRFASRT